MVHTQREEAKRDEALCCKCIEERYALWLKESTQDDLTMLNEWNRKFQVDIVEDDNAAEITGEQRGLIWWQSERMSEFNEFLCI